MPLRYRGVNLDCQVKLLTYLRISGYPLGFLLNFDVPLAKQGDSSLRTRAS